MNILLSIFLFFLISEEARALTFISPNFTLDPVIGENSSQPDHYRKLNYFSANAQFPLPMDFDVRAELQGGPTETFSDNPGFLASLVELKYSLIKREKFRVSLISQMFSPGTYKNLSVREVQQSYILPVDYHFNKDYSTGVSVVLAEDKLEGIFKDFSAFWYANMRLTEVLSTNLNVYALKPHDSEKLMCSDVNLSLNYQYNPKVSLNVSTLASVGDRPAELTHMVGVSVAL